MLTLRLLEPERAEHAAPRGLAGILNHSSAIPMWRLRGGGVVTSSYDSALVDVAMIEDPKMLTLARGIRFLHLEALVWCKAHLTDGFIPAAALNRLTDEPDPQEAAKELVKVGLWNLTAEGWTIIGFTDTQMSAQRVREKRQASRERYDKWQQSQSPKRVSNAAANDPARPAPPARKGGGQVGGNGGSGPLKPAPPATEEEIATLRETRAQVESLDWYRPSTERTGKWQKI
jgi:hypothetical protein